jgi:hypothetical protein
MHGRNVGEGARAKMPPKYLCNLGTVYLVTESKNGKKKDKNKIKNLRFMGPISPSFKFDSFVKSRS